ncbi:MBL fold metallo-hydrolase [uncultured Rikenella sp.]|uniref:MBL fold metallo-hydrolase n=1 Tax=uncultured Rikenella sp. TaxID=368003 RepID=UPI002629F32D|nr:MBL fold metallo-hydrolase [uncultured Rikenella sp.]
MKAQPDTTDYYGPISVTRISHAALYIGYEDELIAVDPYGEGADYTTLPKATTVLITHDHYDHYDPEALRVIATDQTVFIAPPKAAERLRADGFTQRIITLANGDTTDYNRSIRIRALPAYNIARERRPGVPFHPKGEGNGYLLTIDEKRIYIAGDTELIPEMRELNFIFIAFLPLMLPYTMSEEEFIEAAKIIEPEYLYPYHYETVDRKRIQEQLAVVQVR